MTTGPDGRPGRILPSWDDNAAAWIEVVREGRLESRQAATDAAVIGAVVETAPRRVLDVGCGEGWLARTLGERHGIDAVGVDGCEALVAAARAAGVTGHVADYQTLAREPLAFGRFDTVVCNFSLLERELLPLLRALHALLEDDGRLVVQTVHPAAANGQQGWHEESFSRFGPGFRTAMPWYQHSASAWERQLTEAGFRQVSAAEVTHPQRGTPLSLLLRARAGKV